MLLSDKKDPRNQGVNSYERVPRDRVRWVRAPFSFSVAVSAQQLEPQAANSQNMGVSASNQAVRSGLKIGVIALGKARYAFLSLSTRK